MFKSVLFSPYIGSLLGNKDHGMNYITASSVENKDNEITLRNEYPKSGSDLKNERSMDESSLKNDVPLADHSLRKELNPPRNSVLKSYKQTDDSGKTTWDKTHFILGIESGFSMKRKWGQVITGIQNWLRSISSDNVLVSLFTYDSTAKIQALYRKPRDLNSMIDKGIEVNGGSEVDLAIALKTYPDIINADEGQSAVGWLHYGFLFAYQDSPYPHEALDQFVKVKEANSINFFFNALTQIERTFGMTKIVNALEGVHYSVRKGADYGKSFTEALTRDPTKSY